MDQSTPRAFPFAASNAGRAAENGNLAQAILDAIPASVAVLDRNGTITAVNASWRRLGSEPCPAPGHIASGMSVGANLLAEGRAGAHFGAGIRAVLEGREPEFSVDYACHSPRQQRWFRVTAMPVGQDGPDGAVVTQTDITERMVAEERLRIAAIAHECLDGIVVMDGAQKILWVNRAFTNITGLAQQEAVGKHSALLKKYFCSTSIYEHAWNEVDRSGSWRGETMLQRHGSGETYHAKGTLTKVVDVAARSNHYVAHFTDTTVTQQQEAQRLLNEAAYRKTLVREVHHRIKNNLQGITGILRQFADQYPAMLEPINQAIGQVKSISVIHGLLGRAVASSVRLCELTGAIAEEIQELWQTPIVLDIPPGWLPCVIAEEEAVPIALVLNELILNAVKHGGKADGGVQIALRKGERPGMIQLAIANAGQLPGDRSRSGVLHNGLQLVAALMPRDGARISQEQSGKLVITLLQFEPPVIHPELQAAA